MGRYASETTAFGFWGRFFSDHPQKVTLRTRISILVDCVFVGLLVTSLSGRWYRQEWRVANGETLSWTLTLKTASFVVDCSSDSPEFLDYCKTLYGRLGGDLRAVARSVCNAKNRVKDIDIQGLLEESCSDMNVIEKLSVATGASCLFALCLMSLGLVLFLLHLGSGFRNRGAWRASFGCRVISSIALIISCVIYCIVIQKVEDLFHFESPINVAFDPAEAQPTRHELLYGFILGIVAAVTLMIYLPFWWKAAPFDPDPYFLEPQAFRQGLAR